MIVTAFRLQNFMAFRQTEWIELRSICLLFGLNSSGKSALIRALRLLKQSLDVEPGSSPLQFNVEDQLDLGAFMVALHRSIDASDEDSEASQEHADNLSVNPAWVQSQIMTFQFRCELATVSRDLVVARINRALQEEGHALLPVADAPNWIEYSLQYSYDDRDKAQSIKLVSVQVDYPWSALERLDRTTVLLASLYATTHKKPAPDKGYSLEWSPYWYWESDFGIGAYSYDERVPFHTVYLQTDRSFLPDLHSEMGIRYQLDAGQIATDYDLSGNLLNALAQTVRNFLNSIVHLGPARPLPRRLYMLDHHEVDRWRQRGWGAFIDLLISSTATQTTTEQEGSSVSNATATPPTTSVLPDATLQEALRRRAEEKESPLVPWLKNLGLGDNLIPGREFVSARGDVVSSLMIRTRADQTHNLLDVGFGASQVIPILAACLYAPKNSLIIIEQPELHLHPKAQAILADLFIETQNRGVRFLLETHSEHLLIRVRLRVARTSAYFIARDDRSDDNRPDDDRRLGISDESVMVVWIYRIYDESFVQLVPIDYVGDYEAIGEEFRDFFANDMDDILKLNQAARTARKLRENKR